MSTGGLKHGSPPWDAELQVYSRYLCRYKYRGYLVTLTDGSLNLTQQQEERALWREREALHTNEPGEQWFSEHRDCLCCCPPQQGLMAYQRKRLRDQRGLPTQEATWPTSQGGSQWKIWEGNLAFFSLPISQSKICIGVCFYLVLWVPWYGSQHSIRV